jgi:PleD family two-component response regulator
VRVSIGFAVVDDGVEVDYESMKDKAAAALSEAKNTGRNKCVIYRMGNVPFEAAG